MLILVFDTETTGLIKNGASLYDPSNPYIMQISWLLYDTEQNNIILSSNEYIALSEQTPISVEAMKITGITRDILEKHGIPILEALNTFDHAAKQADIIIAHNLAFDQKMIHIEYTRNGLIPLKITSPFKDKKTHCTMKTNIELCSIKKLSSAGKYYNKYPTLMELFKFLYKEEPLPLNLHNSLIDVLVCLRCYCLLKMGTDVCETSESFKSLYGEMCNL